MMPIAPRVPMTPPGGAPMGGAPPRPMMPHPPAAPQMDPGALAGLLQRIRGQAPGGVAPAPMGGGAC